MKEHTLFLIFFSTLLFYFTSINLLFASGMEVLSANINKHEADSVLEDQRSGMKVFVVPEKELIVIQCNNLLTEDLTILLFDSSGLQIKKTEMYQGSTIAYFDTQTFYSGEYVIKISNGKEWLIKNITLTK